jgi:hypothetical protein
MAEPATAAWTVAGSAGAMREAGGYSRVQATGVGTPVGDSTVTTASPTPSEVRAEARS